MDKFGMSVVLEMGMDAADQRLRAALKEQGFGVLTEIDMQATMQKKLGLEMAPYKILGACNPKLAWQALQTEPDVGLLLPCNVLLQGVEGGTRVVIISAEAMFQVTDLPQLDPIAEAAHKALSAVVAQLRAG